MFSWKTRIIACGFALSPFFIAGSVVAEGGVDYYFRTEMCPSDSQLSLDPVSTGEPAALRAKKKKKKGGLKIPNGKSKDATENSFIAQLFSNFLIPSNNSLLTQFSSNIDLAVTTNFLNATEAGIIKGRAARVITLVNNKMQKNVNSLSAQKTATVLRLSEVPDILAATGGKKKKKKPGPFGKSLKVSKNKVKLAEQTNEATLMITFNNLLKFFAQSLTASYINQINAAGSLTATQKANIAANANKILAAIETAVDKDNKAIEKVERCIDKKRFAKKKRVDPNTVPTGTYMGSAEEVNFGIISTFMGTFSLTPGGGPTTFATTFSVPGFNDVSFTVNGVGNARGIQYSGATSVGNVDIKVSNKGVIKGEITNVQPVLGFAVDSITINGCYDRDTQTLTVTMRSKTPDISGGGVALTNITANII